MTTFTASEEATVEEEEIEDEDAVTKEDLAEVALQYAEILTLQNRENEEIGSNISWDEIQNWFQKAFRKSQIS